MSQDIHALLDDCRSKTEELVSAIAKYRSATEVNQAVVGSLEVVVEALNQVTDRIKPFSQTSFRRFQFLLLGLVGLNTVAVIGMIALLVVKK